MFDHQAVYDRVEKEFACNHESATLTRLVASNGAIHWRKQCDHCGETVAAVKAGELTQAQKDEAPPFDREAQSRHRKKWWARYQELKNEAVSLDWAERKKNYGRYLQTPAWCRRRALVLERAGGTCEGCGMRTAVQAHHLTYDRIGREMLFDLVAVCVECHQRIHEEG